MTESKLVSELCAFVAILDKLKVRYCLIGGLAVVVRAYERTTKDIDFAVLISDDKEAEEIVRKIRAESYEIFSLLENTEKKVISTVRLVSKNNKIVVDLLFNSCGIEKEVISLATEVEISESVNCKVASLSSLVAMKILSSNNANRLQDLVDLQSLILEASEDELLEAERLINLIQERGFNGGVNLINKYIKFRDEVKKK